MRTDPFGRLGVNARMRGLVRLEIRGAWPEAVLNACAREGIRLMAVRRLDAYTLRLTVFEEARETVEALSRRAQCDTETLGSRGGRGWRRVIKRRVWLLVFLILTASLLYVSSLFIWQIELAGAQTLSRGELLRALEECGVAPGSYRPGLDADTIRAKMLLRLPELAWMTVNVRGSRATVLLLEREEFPASEDDEEISALTASRSGLIRTVSVLRGRPVVEAGQIVEAGELLVSGDLESLVGRARSVEPKARIMAETWYERTALCPSNMLSKSEGGRSRNRFAVRIGTRRINFYLGSGKSIDACDKIIYEAALGIRGLFCLPLSLIREETVLYPETADAAASEDAMRQRLLDRLSGEIEGEILSAAFTVSEQNGLLAVTLRAHCLENIAAPAESAAP